MISDRLTKRVELQRNSPAIVDHEEVDRWQTYAEAWAKKLDPKGDEVVSALQTRTVMTVVFRIYSRPDVTPKHRVLFEGRKFDIKAVTERDDRGRWMLLHCEETPTDGD